VNDVVKRDNFVGFRVDKLPNLRVGKQIKQVGELMRWALFKQWLIKHS
jgi:hypothetical protein